MKAPTCGPVVRSRSLLWHLVCFGLALAIPIFAFAGVVVWEFAASERARMEAGALTLARAMAGDLDQDARGPAAALKVLAASGPADSADPVAFAAKLDAIEAGAGLSIALRGASGAVLAAPRSFAARNLAALPAIPAEPGRVGVSGYIAAQGSIAMNLPLAVPAGASLILLAPVSAIRATLERTPLPAGWTATALDRDGIILARTARHDELAGRRAADDFLTTFADPDGTWTGVARDGILTFVTFARSPETGWRLAVGVPQALLDVPLRRSLSILGLAGVALAALALLLAWTAGRKITEAAGALASASDRPGGDFNGTGVSEFDVAGRRLTQVSKGLRESGEALTASEARLRTIIDTVPVGLVLAEADGRIVEGNAAVARMLRHDVPRPAGIDSLAEWVAFHEDGRQVAGRDYPLAQVLSGARDKAELECNYRRGDGSMLWIKIVAAPLRGKNGEVAGAVVGVLDIDDMKTAQARQRLMNRELHHRVKNTLATVQGIANLTARSAMNIDAFRQTFAGRIISLSRTHTLLVENAWGFIPLTELLRQETDPYQAGGVARISLDGSEVMLPSDVALALGMAFHELSTNALKYGALSTPDGRIGIEWRVETPVDGSFLVLRWTESGGPAVLAPVRTGFGSQLLTGILARQLKGEVDVKYAPGGLEVMIKANL